MYSYVNCISSSSYLRWSMYYALTFHTSLRGAWCLIYSSYIALPYCVIVWPMTMYHLLRAEREARSEFFCGLTCALLGLWIFHCLLVGGGRGGGAFERPPPMISATGRRREKQKAAFESSRKIISKSFRSFFFGSGQDWGHQGSNFQNFPKRFFDDTIFNF